MNDPKYDRVTREGLKAFGDLCKQKFAQQEQCFIDQKLSRFKNLNILYTDIPDNLSTVKIRVTVLGKENFQNLVFNLDLISEENNSFVFSTGNMALTNENCAFTKSVQLRILVPFETNYNIQKVFISTLATHSDNTTSYLQCDTVSSQTSNSLNNGTQINVLTSKDAGCSFYLKKDESNRDEYQYGCEFSTIQNANQLSHNVKYIMTDSNNSVPEDGYNLSGGTVYILKEQASNSTLGNIKVNGTSFTGKNVPVNIDENGYAYVTLTDTLLKYKGVFNGDYTTFLETEDCKNSTVGDVWTIKPKMSESGAEYVLVEKGDTTNWEYLGEKFTQAQADWNETDSSKPSFIKNRPAITGQVQANWNEEDTSAPSFIQNKPTFEQVQSDWNATEGKGAILNKPSIKIGGDLISTTSTETGTYYDITDKIQKRPVISKLSELVENTLNITEEGTIFLINDTDSEESVVITVTIPEGGILLTNNITLTEENKYTYSFTGKYAKITTDVFTDGETSYYSVVITELTKLGN